MFTIFIRTIIVYFLVVFTLRLQGKRQIGELEPAELVVTIIISEVAALPVQDTSKPLVTSLIAILLLVVLEISISFFAYKSFGARKIFFGTPSVFYEKGKINQKEMEKHRFNLHDLLECVRNTGATSLSEVEYIIMETNGNVSVIPTAKERPATASDVGKNSPSPLLSYILIDDGRINTHNLKFLGFDKEWVKKQIRLKKIESILDVFCMTATKSGEVVIITKEKGRNKK